MSHDETQMGGPLEKFPETSWSVVQTCRDPDSPIRREHLGRLISQYWRPVYAYVRLAWHKPVEDAKDLTQAFFSYILEKDVVAQYQPARSRFRHFLKAVLENFVARDHRDMHRLKRGGSTPPLQLDVAALEANGLSTGHGSPENAFDRQWAHDVVAESLVRLRSRLAAEGKEIHFRVYEAYELSAPPRQKPKYEDIARTLEISEFDVGNHLRAARQRLTQIVFEVVSEYVATREDASAELDELFGRSP